MLKANLKNADVIKQLLAGHGWLGVTVGAVLYLICLSGTVLVFMQEIERWEQPGISEYETLPTAAVANALQQLRQYQTETEQTLWVVLPTESLPRAHASVGDQEWYLDPQGNFIDQPAVPWLEMLGHLHYYLHLPENIGMIIVGIFGVLLLALSISGVLAHPSIIKDAFKFRRSKSYRLSQVDLHNRLGVWGLPFNLMIALTGAFIGVVSLLILVAAPVFYEGDREAVVHAVYGEDPVLRAQQPSFNIEQAVRELQQRAPDDQPIYFAFQQTGSDQHYLEIATASPDRLIYSEIYRFDAAGHYINHQGFSDGPMGRQVAYSVYRLHFGAFDGWAIKVLYLIFGLALSAVCVSGINIWFAKRKIITRLNTLWAAVVWGAPLALVMTALIPLWFPLLPTPGLFWSCLLIMLFGSGFSAQAETVAKRMKLGLGLSLVVLAVSHCYLHASAMTQFVLGFNSLLLLGGIGLLVFALRHKNQPAELVPAEL